MVLQYLKGFSPILKGETDNIQDATTLRDVLAKMNPSDTFIIVQEVHVAVCNDASL